MFAPGVCQGVIQWDPFFFWGGDQTSSKCMALDGKYHQITYTKSNLHVDTGNDDI